MAVPRAWKQAVQGTWVDHSMTLGALREDHRPAMLDVTLLSVHRGNRPTRRGAIIHPDILRKPAAQEDLAKAAEQLRQPPWEDSVHDHCERLMSQIREAALAVRRRHADEAAVGKHSFVQQDTRIALDAERALSRLLRSTRRRQAHASRRARHQGDPAQARASRPRHGQTT